MTVAFSTPFRDALANWRRDHPLLAPLAGATMFLPQLAVLLLVPSLPSPPDAAAGGEAAALAWAERVTDWAGDHGIWFVLAPLAGLFSGLAVMALYLDRGRPTLGGAMRRGALLLPRYVLATILTGLVALTILLPGAASRLLIAFLVAPAFYVLGRTMLAGPVIVAEAPVGAVAAINRSWRLTRGRGWLSAASYAVPLFTAQTLGTIALAVGGANPVLTAIGAALAAAATAAAAITLTLVEISLYRRLLASNGI